MSKQKLIIDGKSTIVAGNINAYLLDAPNIFLEVRSTPLCAVPQLLTGNQRLDNDNYIFTPEEMKEFLRQEPRAQKYFRAFIGGDEFLNGKIRYCLWLGEATVEEINSMPLIEERVEAVRRFRLSSKRPGTRRAAESPTHFYMEVVPTTNYIAIPVVSSERRKYIPMGFMSPDVLCSNKLMLIPNAGLYEFGVLMSIVNMAWVRVVCGRHNTSYDYSASIVYNNFVWASATLSQRRAIEQSAQAILDARALYPSWTLAALYDPNTMPPELRAAHEHNDRLVEELYGFAGMTELEMVTRLMEMNAALSSSSE